MATGNVIWLNISSEKFYFIYRQFKNQQFHVLPKIYFCVCVVVRKNSDYFSLRH